jgi:glucose/arabinose dehydrogenase
MLLLASLVASQLHAEAPVFVQGLESSGTVLALDDGTVLVSRPELNDVVALRDTDGDGRADSISTAVSSIERAYGLAMRGRTLYVAGVKKIVAAERRADGTFRMAREIVSDLPDGGAHPNRVIAIGPDGRVYVAVGSSCDGCQETNPEQGTLLQLDADGSDRRVFARGLRNVTALSWNGAGELLAIDDGALVRIGDGVRVTELSPAALSDAMDVVLKSAGVTVTDGVVIAADAAHGVLYRSGPATPSTMISATTDEPAMPVLHKVFHTDGLRRAESVLHDEEQDVYFVASADDFVSKLAPDGKVLAAHFIDGLRAPGGMAIRDAALWIVDVDKVHGFDRMTGKRISERIIDGAVGLSAIAVGPDDSLYVTDTDVRVRPTGERERIGDGRVYRIPAHGEIEVAEEGEELRSPSGIAWDGSRFVIAQGYGHELLTWSPGSRAKAFARGPGAYEGIVVLPNGAVLVSSQHDDTIHVARGGELSPLFARRPAPGAIGFDRKRNRLLIPSTGGGWLEAWALPPIDSRSASRDSDDGEPELARK